MGKSLTRKIIEAHYVSGSMVPGEEVFIKVDQTLTHEMCIRDRDQTSYMERRERMGVNY